MGRRGYRALLSLLSSVVLFFVFVPDPIVRAVLIPAKFDGFVYNISGTSPDSIVIEAFFDPVCPDSRDDWQPLKRVLAYYAGRVSLIVHTFPLPYHDNAFAASRALHIVNKLNSSATYQLLEMFFKHQAMFYTQRTINMSRASIVDSIVKFVSNSVGQSLFSAVKSGFSDRKTDMATRISFKYGCSRGVLGTPFYFVNGFPLPVPDSVTDYSKWRSILDPLVSESIRRENLHFFL